MSLSALPLPPQSSAGLPPCASEVVLRRVTIQFGAGATAVHAVENLSLTVAPGEFVSIVGPSGCGKSTLVGAVAGFTPLTQGEITVDERPVRGPGADRGVVFQQHALFPWKSVRKNVEFGLKMRGIGRLERARIAREMLAQVGLGEFAEHYPHQLSGGMQQRVNLARVLVNQPRVILMDEPFGSLDAQTRLQMQQLLLGLWHERGMTVIFITHDIDEAVFLSDRVIVLSRRPGAVILDARVELPRPRSYDVLTSPEFGALKRRTLELLLGQTHDSAEHRLAQHGLAEGDSAEHLPCLEPSRK
ncbi:MAG TPA: ABC transporter ATP-binding protein [Polyangiaceae bacterium]|nr:ABC transporter ATP-binding protein [Polyangiaceae bacterium]